MVFIFFIFLSLGRSCRYLTLLFFVNSVLILERWIALSNFQPSTGYSPVPLDWRGSQSYIYGVEHSGERPYGDFFFTLDNIYMQGSSCQHRFLKLLLQEIFTKTSHPHKKKKKVIVVKVIGLLFGTCKEKKFWPFKICLIPLAFMFNSHHVLKLCL
jgi:hypothetical protein